MAHAVEHHLLASLEKATNPTNFFKLLLHWFESTAGTLIDTPEERAVIENGVMAIYDKLTGSVKNPFEAFLFKESRDWVLKSIDQLLRQFAAPSDPTPSPLPNPI